MKYIDFAENERLSTIVLGMMRIKVGEDEVEAWWREPCRLESTPLIWRIFMAMASVSSSLVRSSNVVRIFGTRCGSSQVWDSQRWFYLF